MYKKHIHNGILAIYFCIFKDRTMIKNVQCLGQNSVKFRTFLN